MSVTVQHGTGTITSTETSAETVLANLEALDKTSTSDETPTPSPTVEPVPPLQAPEGEGSAPDPVQRVRDEAGRFAETPKGAKPAKAEPAEKRIARITWEREEAKRREAAASAKAEQLERDLAEARKAAQAPASAPITPRADGEPQLEDFESYEGYTRALARWEVRQELAESRQQEAQQQAQTAEQQRIATFRERMDTWAQAHPAEAPDLAGIFQQPMSPAMLSAIIGAEDGPAILHYLAAHPEECLQLVAETQDLPPTAAPVVRRALARFLGPSAAPTGPAKAPTRSPGPAPIQPVGASPVVPESDPNALPFKDYVRVMNARDLERERVKRGLMK